MAYEEYATITRRTLFINILARTTKNIYSEWCQSVRQLRTDGDPAPFLTFKKCNVYKQWCQSTRQLRTDGDPRPFLKFKSAMYINI